MKDKNEMRKIKRKLGAVIVLGIFAALMLAQSAVATPVDLDPGDWVGLSASEARITFGEAGPPAVTDEIYILDANVDIGNTDPDFKLEVTGTSGNGYFGVTSSSDGDIFIIDDEGRVGIGIANPSSALEIKTGYYTSATSALHVKNSQDTSLFFVRDDGNVGIGVIDPAEKLEIDGNVLLNFGSNREIKIEDPPSQTTSDGKDLTVRAGNANLQYGGITDQDGGDLYLYGGDGEGVQTTYGGDVYIYGGIGHSMWAHDGDVILAYTSSMGPRGKVGIGTASPNEKLEVDGKIRANTCFNVGGTDGISQVITIEGASYTHYLTFSGGILVDYSSD